MMYVVALGCAWCAFPPSSSLLRPHQVLPKTKGISSMLVDLVLNLGGTFCMKKIPPRLGPRSPVGRPVPSDPRKSQRGAAMWCKDNLADNLNLSRAMMNANRPPNSNLVVRGAFCELFRASARVWERHVRGGVKVSLLWGNMRARACGKCTTRKASSCEGSVGQYKRKEEVTVRSCSSASLCVVSWQTLNNHDAKPYQ